MAYDMLPETRRQANMLTKLRCGEGWFWGTSKSFVRAVLHFHLPASGLAKPLFRALYAIHVAGREARACLLRVLWYEPLFRSQCETVGDCFYMEQLPYLLGLGRIRLGRGVRLSGKSSIIFATRSHARPEFTIGDDTFVGNGCAFHIANSVQIGRHCLLARGVSVADFDGHPLDAERRRNGESTPREQVRPVVIEDDAWIGARATILKGVTVGARSIVAAEAVVSKNVPPDVIVAGNPARVVRRLVDLVSAPVRRAAIDSEFARPAGLEWSECS